ANILNALKAYERSLAAAKIHAVEAQVRRIVFARDNYRCIYCGATKDLVLDHFIPFVEGGSSSQLNIVTACSLCNDAKHDSNPAVFIAMIAVSDNT
ncbi:MAG: HNH endonuclease, partial [Planctomycetes bacterium]|nr:HNH endonuclease [Planctomycetota bacterium]